jgi:hypothetical protein
MSSLRILAASLVAASLGFAAPASAQGTDQQRSACEGDAFKFCSGDIPDESAIEACLRRNQSRLTPACQVSMRSGPGEAAPGRASRASADGPAPGMETAAALSAHPGKDKPCLRKVDRLEAQITRYLSANPAGAAAQAAQVMPLLAALDDDGPSLDDDFASSAMSMLSEARQFGLAGSSGECRAAVAKVDHMVRRHKHRH